MIQSIRLVVFFLTLGLAMSVPAPAADAARASAAGSAQAPSAAGRAKTRGTEEQTERDVKVREGDESEHGSDVSGQAAEDHAHAHDHAHEGDHDGFWHGLQDWVIALLGGVHPHGDEHEAHGPRLEPVALTDFSSQTELYVELPPLVVGQMAELLVHLTLLEDWQPVSSGAVTVTLSGGGETQESFTSPAPSRPGLYRVNVTPQIAGRRRIRVAVAGPGLDVTHDLAEHEVYPDVGAAVAARPQEERAEEGVVFLKEQQWQSDFATAEVRLRLLRGSVPATGTLRATADGEAHATAPSPGHLRSVPAGFPYTGMQVRRGQILAYVDPLLGGESDVAGLELAVKRASSNHRLASQERKRLEDLFARRAVAERRLLEARGAEDVAAAELEAARRRLAQVTGGPGGEGAGVPVRAPIDGTVALVKVAAGGYVAQGDRLFHVVNRERLWLEARIAEADLGRIRRPQGAWFRAEGFDQAFGIRVGKDARLVAFGGLVDPVSRTVPIVFEFPSPDERLRVGMFVSARVDTGEEEEALAVPAGALVYDGGTELVYVQRGGEIFERRIVRTGLREGDFVAVIDGLRDGERVVSPGAYLVHLAAAAPAEIGHGHAH